jgi:hypothetical protein
MMQPLVPIKAPGIALWSADTNRISQPDFNFRGTMLLVECFQHQLRGPSIRIAPPHGRVEVASRWNQWRLIADRGFVVMFSSGLFQRLLMQTQKIEEPTKRVATIAPRRHTGSACIRDSAPN